MNKVLLQGERHNSNRSRAEIQNYRTLPPTATPHYGSGSSYSRFHSRKMLPEITHTHLIGYYFYIPIPYLPGGSDLVPLMCFLPHHLYPMSHTHITCTTILNPESGPPQVWFIKCLATFTTNFTTFILLTKLQPQYILSKEFWGSFHYKYHSYLHIHWEGGGGMEIYLAQLFANPPFIIQYPHNPWKKYQTSWLENFSHVQGCERHGID